MGKVRLRKETGTLQFDFFYQGFRCREQTLLVDKPANRKKLDTFMAQIDREIREGSFQYEKYFPNSKNVVRFSQSAIGAFDVPVVATKGDTPSFKDFSEEWYQENEVAWKISYQSTVRGNINVHLLPCFGKKEVSHITKSDILKFRSTLAKVEIGKKTGLSPSRINHIMTTLRMILADAADRYEFNTPFRAIKPLKVPRSDVEPFSIDEVNLILSKVRADFKNYYTVRFFTAMRTGEIDGLQWKYVDFERKQILIRETLVQGRVETPKTTGSIREIQMSEMVYTTMKQQWEITGKNDGFVFCNKVGDALDHRNITKRIWHPLLKYLGGCRALRIVTRNRLFEGMFS